MFVNWEHRFDHRFREGFLKGRLGTCPWSIFLRFSLFFYIHFRHHSLWLKSSPCFTLFSFTRSPRRWPGPRRLRWRSRGTHPWPSCLPTSPPAWWIHHVWIILNLYEFTSCRTISLSFCEKSQAWNLTLKISSMDQTEWDHVMCLVGQLGITQMIWTKMKLAMAMVFFLQENGCRNPKSKMLSNVHVGPWAEIGAQQWRSFIQLIHL